MKESGIEKLIRYLLESKGDEYKEEYYEWYRDVELEQNIDSLSELKPFIKWLVKNDKIDFKNNKLQVLKDIDVRGEVMYDYTLFDKADGVIMLLSISETPIEDLISYLK